MGDRSRHQTKDNRCGGTVATWKPNVLRFTDAGPTRNRFVGFEIHGGVVLDVACHRRAGRRVRNQVENGGEFGGAVGAVELIDTSPGSVW